MSWQDRLIANRDCHAVIQVAAGVLLQQGRVLLTQRRPDAPCGGCWEFPGGKLERDETWQQCLSRELKEELGIEVLCSEWLCDVSHEYPHGMVELSCWVVHQYAGNPSPQEGQPMQWVVLEQLPQVDFPVANRSIIDRLLAGYFD